MQCTFYTKYNMIHVRFPLLFFWWRSPDGHVNIRVFDSNSFIMLLSTPAPAKSFSINTNSRDLDFQVSTKAILEIIRNNPQGLTLTEIAKQVDPNWQAMNCKRMFKQAIDPLCLRDEVRFTVSPSGKRVKYFPVRISKRWLVMELFNQFTNAKNS